MIGFVVPRVYFRNFPDATDAAGGRGGPAGSSSHTVKVYSKMMKDFIGMDNVEPETKKALLDFSFSVTQGKLDEAYRAVKTIGSASIWENMAHMYVIRALLQSSPSPISCSPSPLGTLCLAVSPGHPFASLRRPLRAACLQVRQDEATGRGGGLLGPHGPRPRRRRRP